MKIRVLSKTEFLRRSEHYECTSDEEIDVPNHISSSASDEEIIDAVKSRILELDFDLVKDKDVLDEVQFEIERIEDEDEVEEDDLDLLMKEMT